MYVSVSGNDATARIYDSRSNADPFAPLNPFAFSTYAEAFKQARNGFPDWILFKRGDTFYEAIGTKVVNGRSVSEPFLIGAYGTTGDSPILKIGSSTGIQIGYSNSAAITTQYIALQGLRFYAHTRDPGNAAEYVGSAGGKGINVFTYGSINRGRNILIEGCACLYSGADIWSSGGSPWLQDIDFRRNVIYGNYIETGHAQGSWISYVNNLLVEDNIYDHNGWLIQSYDGSETGGQATIFNHNIYTAGVTNATYRNNIIARASSMGTKFTAPDAAANLAASYGSIDTKITSLVIDDNLYVDGELGIGLSGNYPNNKYAVIDPTIIDNVFYNIGESRPTNRGLSWGLILSSLSGGSVRGNVLINSLTLANSYGITLSTENRNLDAFENIFIQLGGNQELFLIEASSLLDGIQIRNNYFERLGSTKFMIRFNTAPVGITFRNNNYYSTTPSTFYVNSLTIGGAQWASSYEPDAVFAEKTFPDKTRTIETYMADLGETASLAAFYAKCLMQSRYHWDTRFTAKVINTWIRAGYGIVPKPAPIPTPDSAVKAPSGLRIISP